MTLNYETLDTLADAYTPLLALLWLALILHPLLARQWRTAVLRSALGISCLAVCYGLMFADRVLALWPAIGLDYSTHSAVAIAFVAILCTLLPRQRLAWIASLLAYFLLMLYQRYHTVADILSTAIAVTPPVAYLCVQLARAGAASRRANSTAH
ncbi:hypothetical protein OPU71_14880 [Niveibacterium sp. 24ML]|uniref:hypothetical protein n=1 Tax=Niveibacterium sp. 24ML TaxID=2985512 RepID=UPI002271E784|nr:hypothetical protein [Niveibacterium sp. 24ML]MCX9157410.1 hypothetical protein [Niveibacterium sp. 24ML]